MHWPLSPELQIFQIEELFNNSILFRLRSGGRFLTSLILKRTGDMMDEFQFLDFRQSWREIPYGRYYIYIIILYAHVYIYICIFLYVGYSWPNGLTKLADIFFKPLSTPGVTYRLKKIEFFSTDNAGPFS